MKLTKRINDLLESSLNIKKGEITGFNHNGAERITLGKKEATLWHKSKGAWQKISIGNELKDFLKSGLKMSDEEIKKFMGK